MSLRTLRLCLAGTALLASGCGGRSTGPFDLKLAEEPGRIVVDFAASMDGLPRDQWQLAEAHIDGDTLRLRITHGGGCAQHRYGLVAWNGWLESHPVQVGVVLLHDGNGDACHALLHPNLRFDLKPLRDAFAQAYGGPGGTVIIRLDDPSGAAAQPLARLTYTF